MTSSVGHQFYLIRLELVLDVVLNLGFVFSHHVNVVPTTPKFTITIFELQLTELFVNHQTALAVKIPHET